MLGCATPAATTGGASTCVPGTQIACACPGGGQGVQSCQADGLGFGTCGGCQSADGATADGLQPSGDATDQLDSADDGPVFDVVDDSHEDIDAGDGFGGSTDATVGDESAPPDDADAGSLKPDVQADTSAGPDADIDGDGADLTEVIGDADAVGQIGSSCASAADCSGGVCVTTPAGKKCSLFCPPDSCPVGFYCHPPLTPSSTAACWAVDLCTTSTDCDDNNPCTKDSCSGSLTCAHLAVPATPCDDGDGCTAYDTCTNGTCKGSACPLDQFCGAPSTGSSPVCQPAKCKLPDVPASLQVISYSAPSSKANSCDLDGDGLPDNSIAGSTYSIKGTAFWQASGAAGWDASGQPFDIVFGAQVGGANEGTLAWSQFLKDQPGINGICPWKIPPSTLTTTLTGTVPGSTLKAAAVGAVQVANSGLGDSLPVPVAKFALSGMQNVSGGVSKGRICGVWPKTALIANTDPASPIGMKLKAGSYLPDVDMDGDGVADAFSFSFDFGTTVEVGHAPAKGCIKDIECKTGPGCANDICVGGWCAFTSPTGSCKCGSGYVGIATTCEVDFACTSATGCICEPNYIAIAVDATIVCAPDFPAWGNRGDSPQAVWFTNNGDGTISDSNTNLQWQAADNGSDVLWSVGNSYCQASTLGGHADWRMPTAVELQSIIDYAAGTMTPNDLAVPAAFQATTAKDFYYSASPVVPAAGGTWDVGMSGGTLEPRSYMGSYRVRCVRSDTFWVPPSPRFTLDGAGETVHDNSTKLTWQRAVPLAALAWADAKTYCQKLNLAGGGWRLPLVSELTGIVDRQETPPIDPVAFPSTPEDEFWSASPVQGDAYTAWSVVFDDGTSKHHSVDIVSRVRCVR